MKRLAFVGIILLVLASFAAAQETGENVDKVILASTANFPDAMISAAPANKLGIPVLLTDKDEMSASTENALSNMNPDEVVMVGGPAVVSEEVVNNQVASTVDSVTRLWGMTQVGTSIEVADYFWSEGNDEAVIVQYPQDSKEGYRLLGAVKNDFDNEEKPILISKEGTLSSTVISAVERLGAEEVEVYSTEAVNVTQDLESVGVQEVDLEEAELQELTERVENRTAEDLENEEQANRTLVIVAAANFRHAISAPAVPNSNSFVVGGNEQITEAVELARDTEAERIFVTGKPDLAQQIADRIESETNRSVDRVSGENAAENAADIANRNREEWRNLQQERYSSWKEKVNSAPGIQKAANRTLEKADTEIDGNSSQEAGNLLEQAQQAFDSGNYFRAKQLATRALSGANIDQYQRMDREEVQERIQEEREDFHEASRELKELNQEKSQELRNAESMEERLEIIQEFRREHEKTVQELRKEEREKKERNRNTGERFEQNPGDSADVGTSELKLETENNELKAEARYTASKSGYTRDINVQQGEDQVTIDFSLESPEGPAAQMITEYRLEKRLELGNGSYSIDVALDVDGEEKASLTRSIDIHSASEFDTESGDSEENETEDASEDTVKYTANGFQPETVTVEPGEEVTWKDEAPGDMWVAVDQHPSHTQYDGTTTNQHCPDPNNSVFDQCTSGNEYSFTFEEPGTYSYHNHLASSDTGTVVVE